MTEITCPVSNYYKNNSGVPWVSGARGKKWNQHPLFLMFFPQKIKCKIADPKLVSVIFKSEKQKKKKILHFPKV